MHFEEVSDNILASSSVKIKGESHSDFPYAMRYSDTQEGRGALANDVFKFRNVIEF